VAQALISCAAIDDLPRLELVWADGAYAGTFARWLEAERGWRVEVPKHRDRHLWRQGLEEKPKGFQVIPRRWVADAASLPDQLGEGWRQVGTHAFPRAFTRSTSSWVWNSSSNSSCTSLTVSSSTKQSWRLASSNASLWAVA
jgi:hypothetical protein